MIYRAALLSILLLASSCASTPPAPTHAEVKEQYANQLTDRERVILTLNYACKNDMPYETRICQITKKQIDIALEVIFELNNEADSLVTAVNKKVAALIECTYQGHLKDQKVSIIETDAARSKLFAMGKQILSYVGCAAILGAGL